MNDAEPKLPERETNGDFDETEISTPARTLSFALAGLVVGLGSAFAAIALSFGLEKCGSALEGVRGAWWAALLPAVGAGLAAYLTVSVFKEGGGHGVPKVIASVSRKGGRLPVRSIFTGLLTSLLTIASGGSAGPEAPVVVSGAALGSNTSRWFKLSDRDRETLVGCGAAGSIAAIFNAPVTGMVFALEVILGEWSAVNLIPIAISSVVAAETTRVIFGDNIPFVGEYHFLGLYDLGAALGLAVASAFVSLILYRAIIRAHHFSDGVKLPAWLKAGVGGLLVGVMGLAFPHILGEGYGLISSAIHGEYPQGAIMIGLVLAAKITATALTLGSGGAGGVFAPCLVVGALCGALYHRVILVLYPLANLASEGHYALLGMAGVTGGLMQAPLTAVFLIAELTGGYQLLLSVMAVSIIAAVLCHRFEPASFYLRELKASGALRRPRTDARVLADLSLPDLLEQSPIRVSSEQRVRDVLDALAHEKASFLPVFSSVAVGDAAPSFLGLIGAPGVNTELLASENRDKTLAELMEHAPPLAVETSTPLKVAVELMRERDLEALPVLREGAYVGVLTRKNLFAAYRRRLKEMEAS